MSDREAWTKLRAHITREQRSYAATNGRSKDARMVFAALEGAYGGILRKMDSLEGQISDPVDDALGSLVADGLLEEAT